MRTLAKTAQKIGVFFLFAGLCASLVSCDELKYDAALYDNGAKYLKESFMEENPMTLTWEEQSSGVYIGHTHHPLFLIKDHELFETAFKEDSGFKMDFSKRMAVVWSPGDIYHEQLYFKSISVKARELRIELENHHLHFPGTGDASAYYQRWVVITLKTLDVDTVWAHYDAR